MEESGSIDLVEELLLGKEPMLGLVRSGDFRKGTPIIVPHAFGTPITLPEPYGNVNPQANSSLSSNPVTWAPSPAYFGNTVDLSLQTVAPIVVVVPGGTGATNINLTQLLGTPTPTLTYSGAPAGVTLAFAPNPDTGTSVCTITVGASAPSGKYTITIVGTSGTEVDTTNLHLVVAGTSTPAPGNAFGFELEDGSGVLVLEDGTSILLLENQS